MKQGNTRLGRLETQFFAYVQFKGITRVRLGEIAPALGITRNQERELLSRLARRRWIVRIWRGLYAVPERLPPGGVWSPGEHETLAILMQELKGRYQMTGATAFNFHGFDEQVPNWIVAYNNRLSGRRRIGGTDYLFIRVSDKRLGGTFSLRMPGGVRAVYSNKARTLMDAVYDWARFDGIPRAYGWIRAAVRRDPELAGDLMQCARLFGNKGTLRRIGHILTKERCTGGRLAVAQRNRSNSRALIPLDPTRPARGRCDYTWGIIDNE